MRAIKSPLTQSIRSIFHSLFATTRRELLWLALLPIVALAGYYLISPPAARGLSTTVVISQVYGGGGNSGAPYRNDFVELFNRGSSSVSLNGWSIQYTSATGTGNFSGSITNLAGSLAPGQYYLVQMSSGGATGALLPTPDATGTASMSATGGKVALVNSTTGLACNGGSTACNPAQLSQIIDLVGWGTANFFEGAAAAPATSNTTAIFRNNNGCTETDNNNTDFGPAAAPAPRNTATALSPCSAPETAPTVSSTTPANNAPNVPVSSDISITFSEPVNATTASFTISCTSGARTFALSGGPTTFTLNPDTNFGSIETCTVTVVAAQVTDQDSNDPPDNMTADYVFSFTTETAEVCGGSATKIHAVQGSGATSPIVGSIVSIEGIVVGDYQGTGQLGGYFVQEEDADADANPATSEGISIFNASVPVNVGDKVRVKGTVAEFLSSGQTLTQLSSVTSVLVCSSGNPLPTAATVTLPVSSLASWEAYEGMRVNITQTLTVIDNFTLGRFGEVGLSAAGRLSIPTNVVLPGAAANALQDLNDRSRIVLDDGNSQQNIDPTLYPTGGLSALNTLRAGDTLPNLTGVLEQRFGAYRIQPVGPISFSAANLRPATPESVGGTLKVVSLNLLNYFNGNGTGGGFPTSRGADSLAEFTRQRDKTINALVTMNPDIAGLIEMENDAPGNSAIEDLVNGLNAATSPGNYAFINTGVIGTDEIRSALIYKPASVTPTGAFKVLDSSVDPNFIDTQNRPSLAQTFTRNSNGAKFTVVVNHFKSKGSSCNSLGDPDLGDGQENCNQTRVKAATALLNWLATDPTGSGDPDVLIIGDLNSYAKEDPITTLINGGFTDLVNSFLGASAYSYAFGGQFGYLDYALANTALFPQVSGVADWHINADEPSVLDYNVEFKTANHVNTLYSPGPFRTSDHDPVLIGLNLNAPPTITGATISVQQGSPASNHRIAVVSDPDQAANTLGVTVTTVSGSSVTVNGIVIDASGNVTANVTASCTATISTFTLTVTDNLNLTATATLDVTVTANAAPTLSYAAQNVIAGNGLIVNPATGPSDNGSVASIDVQNQGTFTGTVSVDSSGVVTISNAGPVGSHTITIRATDNCGTVTDATFVIAVSRVTGSVDDPIVCTGPGGVVDVTATVTNGANSSQAASFTATLPANLLALPGTCTASVGSCNVVDATKVTWSGNLAGGQTVTINYQAQIGDQVTPGTQLCITSSATVGGSPAGSVTACTTANCPQVGPGVLPLATSPPSDQKAGSVLIYNLYTSSLNTTKQNTQISMTNIHPVLPAYVHLFFVDGTTCSVADRYVTLTPNQTFTFLASDQDPGTSGYLVAVAVDQHGCPANFNYLIGEESVKFESGHAANLGAIAISALAGGLPLCNENAVTATLNFDGVSYNELPRTVAVDSLASKVQGNETMLILNRIGGNLATGASMLGSLFGLLYDDAEASSSFTIPGGTCQLRNILSSSFPRTAPRYESVIPAGRTGWMKLYSQSDAALTGAVINYNPTGFSQGHNLHTLTLTKVASFTIPVYPVN